MNLPRRRKPKPMGLNHAPQIRCASHLAWIRGHECSVNNVECSGRIEAAHARNGTDGGMGLKPSDCWTLPLCERHHIDQHVIGETTFQSRYKIDMKAIASRLWSISPHRRKVEQS